MIDPENDPILNASSINSEDYWFLKLNGNVDENAQPAQDSATQTVQQGDENK
jgi:hypothetical protein